MTRTREQQEEVSESGSYQGHWCCHPGRCVPRWRAPESPQRAQSGRHPCLSRTPGSGQNSRGTRRESSRQKMRRSKTWGNPPFSTETKHWAHRQNLQRQNRVCDWALEQLLFNRRGWCRSRHGRSERQLFAAELWGERSSSPVRHMLMTHPPLPPTLKRPPAFMPSRMIKVQLLFRCFCPPLQTVSCSRATAKLLKMFFFKDYSCKIL